ncbi:siderophore ABC transporter substrate-binding protein [Cellulomonas shaoxiangyii]|uniref:Siderophore ABC transporter substrate-binding protein n=1 Tax=Cellulomonas shaoxiangyii TaxID=2566013 RepID=A0A4P7SP21_9CELL|nr:siderophore ABC transporter substrate-binding protein [Cellulomonas shaoxiangyii]QCB94403.1 siderophore ABC transporter substrate-binding protein [Cellulomonas shaoxiangyii]TGY80176.1 siderophore ABC transporter substrate-binding protein [Cellulomonas shaoxiangyii]
MPTRLRGAALAVAAALVLGACAGTAGATDDATTATPTADEPTTVTVTHAQGETEVPFRPETVVTFDLASLTTLDALGVEVAGLPKQNLPGELAGFDSDEYTNVGTLFEPDYEVVNQLQPDLIIVAGRSSETLPELSKIAPTIDLSNDWADFHTSVVANSEVLGEIFGLEDEVAEMAADLDASIEEVRTAAADAGTGLILLTSGGKVTAYGPGSRFGFLHDALGVTPAVEDVEAATHGEAISFEFVAEAAPEWLFVLDRDAATGESAQAAAQVLDNPLVHGTPAWQAEQVHYLDPAAWYVINGGLPTLQGMTDEIATALGVQ